MEPKSDAKESKYPMRINKYIAQEGYTTRRGADALIAAGKVYINGRPAVLGDKVSFGEKVEVNTKAVKEHQKGFVYYAYNKPVGIVTHGAQDNEEEIKDVIGIDGVSPIGRLDKDSHGLILLTNDGRVTERLLSPKLDHEKEYVVKVSKPLKQNTLTRLSKGIKLEDGYITKPAEVFWDGDTVFRIVLTEGKKHQIRRMVTALGYEVTNLKRVRIMNIELGNLAEGQTRPIEGKELKGFLKSLEL
jgi:23S rRNA pseudouridine2604 synthase